MCELVGGVLACEWCFYPVFKRHEMLCIAGHVGHCLIDKLADEVADMVADMRDRYHKLY